MISMSSAHFTFKCGIVDNHSENPDFGGIHLTASEPFGVITFQCPFLVSKFVVESVLPVKYHKSHDYITFCVVHLQCRVFIYIPASSAVTVTQYTRNTTDTHFTRDVAELMMFDDWNLKIQSHSYLQVVVSIENTERSLYTELVVMPTSLFTTGYIATVPGEFLEYRLIVTFTSRMLPLFLDNEIVKSYEVLRNTNTTTFSSLAYNIRLSMSSKSIDRFRSKEGSSCLGLLLSYAALFGLLLTSAALVSGLLLTWAALVLCCSCLMLLLSWVALDFGCSCLGLLLSYAALVLGCSCLMLLLSWAALVLCCSCFGLLLTSAALVLCCSCFGLFLSWQFDAFVSTSALSSLHTTLPI
ncbi:hypothetical protein Btru_032694 [Bulinus truncatus]|nr:hypothetical protein Btru_032694 [Bulinus truncatus]